MKKTYKIGDWLICIKRNPTPVIIYDINIVGCWYYNPVKRTTGVVNSAFHWRNYPLSKLSVKEVLVSITLEIYGNDSVEFSNLLRPK